MEGHGGPLMDQAKRNDIPVPGVPEGLPASLAKRIIGE